MIMSFLFCLLICDINNISNISRERVIRVREKKLGDIPRLEGLSNSSLDNVQENLILRVRY